MRTILVDIDNTLADQSDREKESTIDGKLNWNSFENPALVALDKPIYQTIEMVKSMAKDYQIVIVTARKEKLRATTEHWLKKYGVPYEGLFMRDNDDYRSDVVFKEDLYQKKLRSFDIFMVLDDRPRIVRMWQSKGLYVLECNNKKGDW